MSFSQVAELSLDLYIIDSPLVRIELILENSSISTRHIQKFSELTNSRYMLGGTKNSFHLIVIGTHLQRKNRREWPI
jgi:hypothetical protein